MTILGPRPVISSNFLGPNSVASPSMRPMTLWPFSPAPLLTALSRVSAGWLSTAAATPAAIPEASSTAVSVESPLRAQKPSVDDLDGHLMHAELSHCKGHLLVDQWDETRVEPAQDYLLPCQLQEPRNQTHRKPTLGHEQDARRLQGTERDVGKEFCAWH